MANGIRRVAVLGANGTMGALSGGLFAQAGARVWFVARSRDKAQAGIEKAVAQARAEELAARLEPATYDELPRILPDCDWVFEALGEDADLKRQHYEVVDRHRRGDCIVSTVSSGLSIAGLAAGRSLSFRQHFLGTHFYNPPGKLPACERIAQPETAPAVMQFADEWLRERLRRVVVPTRDVPAFAGNRIGFQFLNLAARLAEDRGVTTIDTLLGSYTGRAMPPLRTIDLVGLDVHRAIVENVQRNAPQDCAACFAMPDYMKVMIAHGQLGSKARDLGGFYGPKQNGTRPAWNPHRGVHEAQSPPQPAFVDEVKALLRDGLEREAMTALFAATGPEAQLVQRTLVNYVHYAFDRVGDVTEAEQGIHGIDAVMAHGFSWAPPGAFVDLWGGPQAAAATLEKHGFRPPETLLRLPAGERVCRVRDVGRFFAAA